LEDKKMKKLFFLLCLLLCFTCLLCACDEAETPAPDPDPTPTHTHEWGEWRTYVLATCTTEGQEKRLCACGEAEMRTVPVSSEHTFTERSMTEEYECNSDAFQTDGIYYYKCSVCSAKGTKVYVTEDAYVYFGEYPQTLKDENVTVTETTDSRGYFLGSDGAYYAKLTAAPYNAQYTFSSGEAVISGLDYYFKVEPIAWRVHSSKGNTVTVVCDSVIDRVVFDQDKSADQYANSDVRTWLNTQFFNAAFSADQQEIVTTTKLIEAEESIEDKVFLLSRDEVNKTELFATNDERRLISSDYIRAIGARVDPQTGVGIWWIRTFANGNTGNALVVFTDGGIYQCNLDITYVGVAPALTLDLP
jgi:hypothetical protein